jgi:hypothetical protein
MYSIECRLQEVANVLDIVLLWVLSFYGRYSIHRGPCGTFRDGFCVLVGVRGLVRAVVAVVAVVGGDSEYARCVFVQPDGNRSVRGPCRCSSSDGNSGFSLQPFLDEVRVLINASIYVYLWITGEIFVSNARGEHSPIFASIRVY